MKNDEIKNSTPFRILITDLDHYRIVVKCGKELGFDWLKQGVNTRACFAVVFYPNCDGKAIMRRQASKYCPNSRSVSYAGIRILSMDKFMKARVIQKSRTRKSPGGYSIRATDKEGYQYDFTSAAEAVEWLKITRPRANRAALYQAIGNNSRKTAYGYRWTRLSLRKIKRKTCVKSEK